MSKTNIALIVGTLLLLAVAGWAFVLRQNTVTPSPSGVPSATPTTVQPTGDTQVDSSPTVTSGTTFINIYMVALDDDGKSGKQIGCGDSLIPVKREITKSQGILVAALNEQLSQKDQYYGESGLYNALSGSSLQVEKATITGGVADVRLTGSLSLGGVCDDPRVEEMLKAVVMQFPTVKQANIFLNGVPIHDALSEK